MIKGLILAVLALILISLAAGVFYLMKDSGKTRRMVTSLTVRVTLSLLLLILLLVGYYTGTLQPHNL